MIQDEIRPFLQSYHGDIELVSYEENGRVIVRLDGTCENCPSSQQTLSSFIETKLKSRCPEIKQVALLQQVSESLIQQALQILRRDKNSGEYNQGNE